MTESVTGGHGRGECRVVLTGPIGAGKSAVGALLAARGALVVDADSVGHEVLAPGGEAVAGVGERWPSVVVDTPGGAAVDRARLAAIVFADPSELAELEALTHPHIFARVLARVAAAPPRTLAVVELPLADPPLPWPRLVVLAPAAVRFARAVARGMDSDDVARRIAAQPTDEEWRSVADWVIDNDGSFEDLAVKVDGWWTAWIESGPPTTTVTTQL